MRFPKEGKRHGVFNGCALLKAKKISAHNSKMECVRTKKELRRKSENNKKRDL
jgi:hypothetical protein